MTLEEANKNLIVSLARLYDEREASSITSLVMERLTGMRKSERMIHKADSVTEPQMLMFQQILSGLLQNRPVQYVLGEAWFGPYLFYVDENVLIPRPETEELVDWLLSTVNHQPSILNQQPLTILDIGTGSGCIPVYIKKKRPDFHVSALDISKAALDIAQRNSLANHAEVHFFLCDILNEKQWETIPLSNLIISNPPYIPEYEKGSLERHVRDFEPALALFVPDQDPILYYKMICVFALQKLSPGGMVFLESHRDFAQEIAALYQKKGFLVEIRKDFAGNNRMIKAERY